MKSSFKSATSSCFNRLFRRGEGISADESNSCKRSAIEEIEQPGAETITSAAAALNSYVQSQFASLSMHGTEDDEDTDFRSEMRRESMTLSLCRRTSSAGGMYTKHEVPDCIKGLLEEEVKRTSLVYAPGRLSSTFTGSAQGLEEEELSLEEMLVQN